MPIQLLSTRDAEAFHECLRDCRMLVQRRRRCEDSRHATLADVRELLAHPALARGIVTASTADGRIDGLAVASVDGDPEATEGRLHLFAARPGAAPGTAAALLDHLLAWFAGRQAGRVIHQTRLDPLSGVFRSEQDRDLLAVFRARGFAEGPAAGNMEADLHRFAWSDLIQSREADAAGRGIRVRAGNSGDAAAIRALNRAEGLPAWDYHLAALEQAGRLDLLHVAERAGREPEDRQLAGYAGFFAACWDSDLPEFGPLLVASSERAHGLGSVLVAHALRLAQAHGHTRVRLSTMSNRFSFYRALGFEVTVTWHEQLSRIG